MLLSLLKELQWLPITSRIPFSVWYLKLFRSWPLLTLRFLSLHSMIQLDWSDLLCLPHTTPSPVSCPCNGSPPCPEWCAPHTSLCIPFLENSAQTSTSSSGLSQCPQLPSLKDYFPSILFPISMPSYLHVVSSIRI